MKFTRSILLVFSLLLAGWSVAQEEVVDSTTHVARAVMIESIELPPYCASFAFAGAYAFKLISFSDTTYKTDSITFIFKCPRSYALNFFEKNAIYTIHSVNSSQTDFGWTVNSNSIGDNSNGKEYWVTKAIKED